MKSKNIHGFDQDYLAQGFMPIRSLLSREEVSRLSTEIEAKTDISPGDRRLLDHPWCRDMASIVRSRLESTGIIPKGYAAILCTLFDKSSQTNWSVAPHRDLSIPVGDEFSAPGWKNWTRKQDIPYVQPPAGVVKDLFAVRVNIDPCDGDNVALLVAPGSHKSQSDIPAETIIEGGVGDALLMSPMLIHASRKSKKSARRRVLHFLFGPIDTRLPHSWFYAVE